MRCTAKFRISVLEAEAHATLPVGKYTTEHVSIRDTREADIVLHKATIKALLHNLESIDGWHEEAILDIFASELATGMSNNIANYVWEDLVPYKYSLKVLAPKPSRTAGEIEAYINSFSNSCNLLKHVFATELDHYAMLCGADAQLKTLMLHEGSEQTPLSLREVVDVMLRRAERRNCASVSDNSLEAIIDTAFPELLFALRQIGQTRFSVSSSSNHTVALTTAPVKGNDDVISRIRASARRLTPAGEVVPSSREYLALGATFLVSTASLVLVMTLNWAQRGNLLERVFDGVGLFGIVSGIMLTVFSRRLDFFDLIGIIFRRKRFLGSYAELLYVIGISENELKSALTFEGVFVPPIARASATYSFEEHKGVFDTYSGLNSNVTDINIIIGNKTAIARGANTVLYFEVVQGGTTYYLTRRTDASYRIVTTGNEKVVR